MTSMKFCRRWRRSTRRRLTRLLTVCLVATCTTWMFTVTHTNFPPPNIEHYQAQDEALEEDVALTRAVVHNDRPVAPVEPVKPVAAETGESKLRLEDITWIKPFLDDPIINPHKYKYILKPTEACKDDTFLLVYIHSHPLNSQRRSVIRKTWGNPKHFSGVSIKVIFVIGIPVGKEDIEDTIQLESIEFEDIVQENFVDAYENMTLKAIAGLKWITNHCSQTKYVMKTDDDALINTYAVLRHLQDLEESNVYNQKLLLCRVWWKMDVSRVGKWAVPEDAIPDKYYPPYCSGIMYLMSIDVARVLYRMSLSIRPFWVDDVYITGLIPGRIGLQHSDFIWAYAPVGELDQYYVESEWYKYAYTHINNMTHLTATWDRIQKYSQSFPIPHIDKVEPGKIAKDYKLLYNQPAKKQGDGQRSDPKESSRAETHNYNRILEPNSGCDENTFLVNFIYTDAENTGRRRLLRNTWARESLLPDLKMKTIFVAGLKSHDENARQNLELEAEDHGDILLEDFEESFDTMYLKTLAAFKWIVEKCSKAKFVLKADDDTLVNMFTLSLHLQDLASVELYRTGVILCNRLWTIMPVAREGMYRVPEEVFPDNLLPPYCSGLGWVASGELPGRILEASHKLKPPFVIDDALITGYYVREIQHVRHYDLRHTFIETDDMVARLNGDEWYKYLFSHVQQLVEAKSVWARLVDLQMEKPAPKPSIIEPGRLS